MNIEVRDRQSTSQCEAEENQHMHADRVDEKVVDRNGMELLRPVVSQCTLDEKS